VQMKNDSSYTDNPDPDLDGPQGHIKRGILEDSSSAVPLIKIFFAMTAKRPSLNVVRKEPSEEYPALIYEIWCVGLSSKFLSPIEDDNLQWHSLLLMKQP